MARLKKEASDKTKLRRMKKELDAANVAMAKLRGEVAALAIRLDEARRRTIPLGPGGSGGSLNFLPAYASQMESRRPYTAHQGADGRVAAAYGDVEVVIHAFGRVVRHEE